MADDKKLHRIYVFLNTTDQWYDVMRECRAWFGKDWKGMSKVRRKLSNRHLQWTNQAAVPVWFEVPDERFATWISVKMSLQVMGEDKFNTTK